MTLCFTFSMAELEKSEEKDERKRKLEADKDGSGDGGGGEDSDSDDEIIGPVPTEAKKPKVLEFEKLYLDELPDAHNYEKSFMHRDVVTFVRVADMTGFVITASCDGHVKFWKKTATSALEFVKHFRAHLGNVQDIAINHNGTLLATVSNDKTAKVFDVVNFDMINIIKLGEWDVECS
jgi:peptidylprolyl isomerase domain and WD repeat-containing protein 1